MRLFVLRLAVVLRKSIEEIEAMPVPHLREWLAYNQIEPLPDAHWDAALNAFTTATALGGKNQRIKFSDFLPRVGKRKNEPKIQLDARQTSGLLSRLMGRK